MKCAKKAKERNRIKEKKRETISPVIFDFTESVCVLVNSSVRFGKKYT